MPFSAGGSQICAPSEGRGKGGEFELERRGNEEGGKAEGLMGSRYGEAGAAIRKWRARGTRVEHKSLRALKGGVELSWSWGFDCGLKMSGR